MGRPLFWSFWLLAALAEVGSVWIFWQVFPGYPALFDGTIVTYVVAAILRDSMRKHPPYSF